MAENTSRAFTREDAMLGPIPPDAADTDIVIWRAQLVATMLDLLDEAIVEAVRLHRWDVVPWRRVSIHAALRHLLERNRAGWIIAEVPAALVVETRALRTEAHRRLQGR